MTESRCIVLVLHVYDLSSFSFPINNYSYSYLYSGEYCSELFGIQPIIEKRIFGTALPCSNVGTITQLWERKWH